MPGTSRAPLTVGRGGRGRSRTEGNVSALSKSASSPLSKAPRDFNRAEQSRGVALYVYTESTSTAALLSSGPSEPSGPVPAALRLRLLLRPLCTLHLYPSMTQAARAGGLLSIAARNSPPSHRPVVLSPWKQLRRKIHVDSEYSITQELRAMDNVFEIARGIHGFNRTNH